MTLDRPKKLDRVCGRGHLYLEEGDITATDVDCVVNAANAALAGGGGVDGAIHRAGGPSIARELKARYPNGCPTGRAVVTQGGFLSARILIHAVGPRWQGGGAGEEDLLRGAYRTSLTLAEERGCQDIAFPAISCGVYGYPLEEGARVGVQAAIGWLQNPDRQICSIRFVLFDGTTFAAFERALENEL